MNEKIFIKGLAQHLCYPVLNTLLARNGRNGGGGEAALQSKAPSEEET